MLNKMNFKANLSHSLIVAYIILFSLSTLASAAGKAPIADARIDYNPAEVNLKLVRITVGETVYFDGSLSFDPDGSIVKYTWDFDDSDGIGEDATGVTTSHIYTSDGTYTATLKVEDNEGQSSVIPSAVTVEVKSGIHARIKKPADGMTFTCKPGETIEFVAEVTGGTPCYELPHYTYEWKSDRGGIIGRNNEFKIEAMYFGLGTHNITLNVTDCIGDTASDIVEIIIVPRLRAEILNLYDWEYSYWDVVLYANGTWDPNRHFSGGGSDILHLPQNYTRVILREACFDDEGYIEVNGNIVYENNDGCCSPGCHQVERDITEYVHPGDNTIYGYAEDCCGSYGYVSAYIQIEDIPSRRCSVLEEFSDGFKEKILRFPPAGGSNSEAKITLPINATVCDAKLDVGNPIQSTELVFVIDTSGSMEDEWDKICNDIIPKIAGYIGSRGVSIDINVYGIEQPGSDGGYDWCANSRIWKDHCEGYDCFQFNEAWGPGTEWIVNNHPWRDSSLMMIFPISDTAPVGYADGTNEDENERSIDNAIQAANARDIKVYGFWGDADDGYSKDLLESHMTRLSSQTGGSAEYFGSASQVVETILDAVSGKESDVTLDIGNDNIIEWRHDDFLGWDTISDKNTNPMITGKLTQLLRDCDCPGCNRSDSYCTIDLEFTTDPGVNLTLKDMYILYCVGAGEVICPQCQINWTGRAKGGLPPYNVKWISMDDGVVDDFWIKNDWGTYTLYTTPPMVPPLTEGAHNIKFEVEDDIGSRASDSRHEVYVPWCCALDTNCHTYWPKHEGPLTQTGNEYAHACDMYEVCHPDLWQLAREAILCCKWNCTPGFCKRTLGKGGAYSRLNLSCRQGYDYGAELGLTPEGLTQDGIKRCAGVYLINGFGPTAKFMSDYFFPEVCCLRHSLCWSPEGDGYCCQEDLGKCRCAWHVYTRNSNALSCGSSSAGFSPGGWRSDVAMNRNSCGSPSLPDFPAHASILGDQGLVTEAEGINSGTCCDYSNALVTMLRIIGYGPTEAYSVTGEGHCFNLVRFPQESPRQWHLVDTTGNKEDPWKEHGLPGGTYPYCSYYATTCRNDNGVAPVCPPIGETVYGC